MTGSTEDDTLTVDIDDGVVVVRGDIDMAGGPVLEAAIVGLENDRTLVIDLAGVSFIDSSGLRSLLGASRRARARGADVALRSIGPEVTRLLEITGTTGQFLIEDHHG